MFRKFLIGLFLLFSVLFLAYILLPNPDFPASIPVALQSKEPADTETSLMRAYFTDYSREEVINWYKDQFSHSSFYNLRLPILRFNYPPEDSQTVIRDQTKSTYLEEIVHPFREGIYINGFEPKEAKDAINIEGSHFRQKIIIRYVPSSPLARVIVGVLTLVSMVVLVREYSKYAGKN